MKRRLLQFAQIAVTTGVLVWLFHDPVKRQEMAAAILRADWRWLMLGVVVGFAGEIAGILRWRLFLEVQGLHCRLRDIARWFFIALFFNMCLPGTTGGDLARLYYLCREHPGKRSEALLTLVVDRMTGQIPLISVAVLTTIWNIRWLTSTAITAGLLYPVVTICGIMALVIAGSFVFSGARLGEKLPAWLPGKVIIIQMSESWHLFASDRRRFAEALLLSFPILFSYYGGFYCVSRALHTGVSLGQMLSIMPVVTVLSSLPISVGGLGLREGLFERLLGNLCGTPPEVASVVSLLGYTIFLSFGLLGAIIYAFSPPLNRQELPE